VGRTTTRRAGPVEYPESDGSLIAETDWHREEMFALLFMLEERYRDDSDAYVSGHMLVYYEEGNPRAVFAPDVFVVFGVPKRMRPIYKLWEEGRPPDIVFELSSRSTRRQDTGPKKDLCAALGVAEYYLFDPLYEYLRPPVQGFLLLNGVYRAIEPDENGGLFSPRLGLRLWLDDRHLQATDQVTGERLLRLAELGAARRDAERRAAEAEAELARLRRRLGEE